MDKKITQQKSTKQKLYKKNFFPLKEIENLTESIKLPVTSDLNKNIQLIKFLISSNNKTNDARITTKTSKPCFDPVFRQLKSWNKIETKSIKSDITILGKKLRFSENSTIQQKMKKMVF